MDSIDGKHLRKSMKYLIGAWSVHEAKSQQDEVNIFVNEDLEDECMGYHLMSRLCHVEAL